MKKKIHQLLAGASIGDAITKYAMSIKQLLLKKDIGGEIFAPSNNIEKSLTKKIFPLNEMNTRVKKDDSVIYHYSIGSPATDYFKAKGGYKIICYHNITPPEFFLPYSDGKSTLLREGRCELESLSKAADFALADSDFNKNELLEMGYKNVSTLPLFLFNDLETVSPSKRVLDVLKTKKFNFLFVGRVVPNKGFSNLLKIFSVFNHAVERDSSLFCIGNTNVLPKYYEILQKDLIKYKIQDSVHFTGRVSDCELKSYYMGSSAFLCLSEHEGFCLPLIESMKFGLPVFALNKTAVAETLLQSGVQIEDVDVKAVTELIYLVLNNDLLVKSIIRGQKNRLKFFSSANFENRLMQFIQPLI